jgi:hypothetical protein
MVLVTGLAWDLTHRDDFGGVPFQENVLFKRSVARSAIGAA